MPRKPGRPKGSTKDNPKGVFKTIRLSAEDWADVENAAGSMGTKTSEFIRWCIRVGLARWRRYKKEK